MKNGSKEYWDNFEKMLDEDLANPNGYWNTLKKQQNLTESRFDKFEKWLEINDFETFFQKLLLRNGKKRDEWCLKHGYEKYGTPLMLFITDFISSRREEIIDNLIDSDFQSGLWYFKGYYFQLICGQGCFWRIYNKNREIIEDV